MDEDQILSVCSGIGGLDLGLSDGLRAVGRHPRTVCMVEREAFPVAVLAKQMQAGRLDECPLWLGDLRDLPVDELPEIDWITGGYPCQPFSAAGKRMGEEDPRHLWPVILDIVRTLRPRGVFFENVAGHMSLGLDRVLRDLASSGYRSAFGLFTAEEVRAPHRRERVFILGVADGDGRGFQKLGERDGEPQEKRTQRRDDPSRCDSDVADANRNGEEWDKPEDREGRRVVDGSEDVADAGCQRLQRPRRERRLEEGRSETQIDRRRDALADADGRGGRKDQLFPKLRPEGALEPSRNCGGAQAGEAGEDPVWRGWPSRPQEPQADWEPPRTIERDMGRDTHGLPCRVDRLRALGNAVVPQQAAKAFVTLWKEVARC